VPVKGALYLTLVPVKGALYLTLYFLISFNFYSLTKSHFFKFQLTKFIRISIKKKLIIILLPHGLPYLLQNCDTMKRVCKQHIKSILKVTYLYANMNF